MDNDADLWSDEINAFVDAAFDSGIVSRNPSFHGEVAAYRYAIKLAIDETRQAHTDAKQEREGDCPKCVTLGDDCGEHAPSWEELANYWKAEAERRQPQSDALKKAEMALSAFMERYQSGCRADTEYVADLIRKALEALEQSK